MDNKGLFVILIVGLFSLQAIAQARREAGSAGGKANTRPVPTATPKPDATPADEAVSDSGETITVDTNLVAIPIRALDRSGRFVPDLTKGDFRVWDNGIEQDIAYFTNEEQPFTVALVLDMSYSTAFKIHEIQAAAISFIDQLRPNDRVMVISFDQDVHVLCEATSDRTTIYKAIRSTAIATGTSLYEAVGLAMNQKLRQITGRKAIVLFTDGVDTTSHESDELANLSDARELDALIYPIRYDTYADVQAIKNRPIPEVPGSLPRTPPIMPEKNPMPIPVPITVMGRPSDRGTSPDDYARAAEYLDKLAMSTGGQLFMARDLANLDRAFRSIASELREFYSIGYYPTQEGRPGEVRRVKVKSGREGIAVRARDTYNIPRDQRGRRR